MRTRVLLLAALCSAAFTCAYAQGARDPYINRVYEYVPAPGQFINLLPEYEAGDTEADMIRKVEEQIVGRLESTNYICLGGWGGYVVFGFDHTVANVPGAADFEVGGNYFESGKRLNPYTEKNPSGTFSHDSIQCGSSEPGIISVMRDENGNGLPDDTWYEIAGSEYPYTRRNYSVSYARPANGSDHVVGIDTDGNTVVVRHNNYHPQNYFPLWIESEDYTLSGSLLPRNITGSNLLTLDFGYADNAINGTNANGINIDWAVDEMGIPVALSGIDFVRVQTGVCQDGGAMGETSTEVTGARDLHPDVVVTDLRETTLPTQHTLRKYIRSGQFFFCHDEKTYNAAGVLIGE